MTTPTTSIAQDFVTACRKAGFTWEVQKDRGILRVRKTFAPDDRDAFIEADMTGPNLLSYAPITGPGSTWGTDGGTVGGFAALRSGDYMLNRSGVSKRFLAQLAKF